MVVVGVGVRDLYICVWDFAQNELCLKKDGVIALRKLS